MKNTLDHIKAGNSVPVEWGNFASMVQVVVKDNGSDTHPEDMYYIFKQLYHSRFSKDTQEVGLGLSLAKAVVEAYRGTIEMDNMLDAGTAFTINFLIPTKL